MVEFRLATRFRDRHYFQEVTVGILEVKPTSAAAAIDVAVVEAIGPTAVGHTFRLHSGKDGIKVGIADVESVMMALTSSGIVTGVAPPLGFVGESQRQTVVDLHAGEEAPADLQ